MKKILLVLILAMIGMSTHAQSWAQPGATWYYDYTNSWTVYGYHEIQKTGDTTINGYLCDNLFSTFHGYDYLASQFFTSQSRNYTYISNDTLYYLYRNQFVVMAVFTAQVGDRWNIPYDSTACNLNTPYLHVDSLGQGVFSVDTLPVLYLTAFRNNLSNYSLILTKKIGYSLFMFDSMECF